MGRSRKNDLTMAKEILKTLEFDSTAKLVAKMEEKVDNHMIISWSDMQNFFDTFEIEIKYKDLICQQTFEIMQRTIMNALGNLNIKNQNEFRNRAFNAPSVDTHVKKLDAGLSTIHAEIHKTGETKTGVLLMMLGHIVRWQVLEDFAKEWVGHWGKGLNDKLNNLAFELLLTLKIGKKISQQKFESDSRLYRDAISHGGFEFIEEHKINFWTRDGRRKKHELPTLTSGDIFELYNRTEKRLRIMEIMARVIRAWGRHSSKD